MKLSSALITESFNKGTYIIKEKEFGNMLYIIKEGEAKVTIKGEFIRILSKVSYILYKNLFQGDCFGERALLYDEQRTASIIANSDIKCAVLSRNNLNSIFGDLQDLLYKNVISEGI